MISNESGAMSYSIQHTQKNVDSEKAVRGSVEYAKDNHSMDIFHLKAPS